MWNIVCVIKNEYVKKKGFEILVVKQGLNIIWAPAFQPFTSTLVSHL